MCVYRGWEVVGFSKRRFELRSGWFWYLVFFFRFVVDLVCVLLLFWRERFRC